MVDDVGVDGGGKAEGDVVVDGLEDVDGREGVSGLAPFPILSIFSFISFLVETDSW